jgi:spore germination cell wall hydrolase CwlJ-like protein
MVKKISKKIKLSLKPSHKMRVLRRKVIIRQHGWMDVCRILLKNKWERLSYNIYLNRSNKPEFLGYRFPRERFLTRMLGIILTATVVTANAEVGTSKIGPDLQLASAAERLFETNIVPKGPPSWITGEVSFKGTSEAVKGAYQYALAAGYKFAANEVERDELIQNGTFVRLDSKYIRLNKASSPYVLPPVARFIDRLGEQYAATGCGKLVVNGGMRPLDFQGTLKNGSSKSVHPTGMAADLQWIVPETKEDEVCLKHLKSLLTLTEKKERADVTAENYNRHFHVVVVPHVYEAFLARQPKIDPEVKWLATALYFETAGNESRDGYRAIGWAIRNRVRSTEYPNTIVEVVADGAAKAAALGKQYGCQFSFMCDGKVEHIQTLCTKPDKLMEQYWLNDCDQKWEAAVEIAKQVLAEPESADPTGGAVLYYATWMSPKPNWVVDMERGTIKTLGSHTFGCSTERGDDACRT